ncbi:MAG: ArsR/SmtB family transcription factor [Rhizobiaceae bacterium]
MNEANTSDELDGAAAASVNWMRAAGEPTRIRLLVLLEKIDLTVSDLMEILGQSQPRLSRHLKLLVDAGLATRFQEGAWAYFRTVDRGPARDFLDAVTKPLANAVDDTLRADSQKLETILERRNSRAADYFATSAQQWSRIRSLHIEEGAVEKEMLELGLARKPASILDLGTGTGRILQLFAPHVRRGLGIDLSHDMLAVARSALSSSEFDHVQIRHGSVYELGEGMTFDLVVMHQVLHYLEDPALALQSAAVRMAQGATLLIADFLPHDIEELREKHAHRRLGIDSDQLMHWLASAGLKLGTEKLLPPPEGDDISLTVALWTAVAA